MPEKHAFLSASSSNRWIACPPSAKLNAQAGGRTSEYAVQGTCAHTLCEYKLKTALGMSPRDPTEGLEFYDREMEECAEGYTAFVLEMVEKAREVCRDPVILVEQMLDLSRWIPESFGTADALIVSDDTLTIVDMKYGKGPYHGIREGLGEPDRESVRRGGLYGADVPAERREDGSPAEAGAGVLHRLQEGPGLPKTEDVV